MEGKRKRRDFDYVYPFDYEKVTPIPPFIRTGGGLETNGITLFVKSSAPIDVDSAGVQLKIGNGLRVSTDGRLEATGGYEVDAPLQVTNGRLRLQLEPDLEVREGKLGISTSLPLQSNPNLHLNFSNGLQLIENNLMVDISSPLTFANNAMTILTNDSLQISGGLLACKFNPRSCITYDAEGLKLVLKTPLAVNNNTLQLLTGAGLHVPSDKLELHCKANSGLELGDEGIGIKAKPKSGIVIGDGGIGLNIASEGSLSDDGSGLKVITAADGGILSQRSGLTIKLAANSGMAKSEAGLAVNVKTNGGLNVDSQGLRINLPSDGALQSDNEGLVIKLAATSGLQISADGIALKIGTNGCLRSTARGLEVMLSADGNLQCTPSGIGVKLNTDGGLQNTPGGISAKLAENGGLKNTGSGLSLALAAQSCITTSNGMNCKVSSPITNNGSIALRYNTSDFTLQGEALALRSTETRDLVYASYGNEGLNAGAGSCPVWPKGNTAQRNGTIRAFITLNWVGSQVNGMLRFKIVSSDFNNMNTTDPIQMCFILDPIAEIKSYSLQPITFRPDNIITKNRVQPSNYYIALSKYFNLAKPGYIEPFEMSTYWKYRVKIKVNKYNLTDRFCDVYVSTLIHETRLLLYFFIDVKADPNVNFFLPADSEKYIQSSDIFFNYAGLQLT